MIENGRKCQNGWLGLQCYPGGAFGFIGLVFVCSLEREKPGD